MMNYNYEYDYSKPSIFSVNVFYLIAGLMLLLIGFFVQSRSLYFGLIVTEVVLILLPNILFLKMSGFRLRRVLRLNGFTFKQLLYTILMVLFSYPIAVFANLIILNIINLFTDFTPASVPMPKTPEELLISFLVIALMPGICEEVMFRGTMLSGYESAGYKKSIIITSLLFGLFHFNIANLAGPTVLGIIFAIIAIKSGSLFLPIIGHTLNNSIALLIGYFATKFTPELDSLDTNIVNSELSETMAIIISTIIIGIIACLCGLVLYKLIKKFPVTASISEKLETSNATSKLSYIPVYIVVLIFIVLSWIILNYV